MTSKPFILNETNCPVEAWNDPLRGVVTWRTLLSGDRTPTDSLTMGVAEVIEAENAIVKVHRHREPEAYYILSGCGIMHIEGVEHPLSAGDVVFIPGGAVHGARGVGPEPLRLLYVFAADSFDKIEYEFPAARE